MDYESIQAINNSSLSWFERSPKYYNAMLHGEIKQSEASYYDFGTMLHCAVLQPTVFNDSYVVIEGVIPTHNFHVDFCKKVIAGTEVIEAYSSIYSTKNKKPADVEKSANELFEQYSSYIKFMKDNSGKTIVTQEDYNLIQLLKNSLASHKAASQLLFSDFELKESRPDGKIIIDTELIIEFIWPKLNKKCKSRLDKIIIDLEDKTIKLIDLKTLSKPVKSFKYSCKKYGYIRQMGFYSCALASYLTLLGLDSSEFTIEHILVAIETIGLHETRVLQVSYEDVLSGIRECHMLLSGIIQHEKLGEWDYSIEYYEGNGVEKLILNDDYDESNNDE